MILTYYYWVFSGLAALFSGHSELHRVTAQRKQKEAEAVGEAQTVAETEAGNVGVKEVAFVSR